LQKFIAVDFNQRNISDEFIGFSLKCRHNSAVGHLAKAKIAQFF